MIRKIFSVLFGLLILAVAARAETGEEIALAAYPGYVVASSDSGNGFGVFALENGNETALCIVEDGRLTIANERAFKAGKNVKVYVDTDGESLFVRSNTEYEYVTLHAEYRAEVDPMRCIESGIIWQWAHAGDDAVRTERHADDDSRIPRRKR